MLNLTATQYIMLAVVFAVGVAVISIGWRITEARRTSYIGLYHEGRVWYITHLAWVTILSYIPNEDQAFADRIRRRLLRAQSVKAHELRRYTHIISVARRRLADDAPAMLVCFTAQGQEAIRRRMHNRR